MWPFNIANNVVSGFKGIQESKMISEKFKEKKVKTVTILDNDIFNLDVVVNQLFPNLNYLSLSYRSYYSTESFSNQIK